jgi:glycine cleavage system H lipoate-binding protein
MLVILAILTFVVFISISYLADVMKRRSFAETVTEGPALHNAVIDGAESVEPVNATAVAILPGCGKGVTRVEGYALPESLYYHQGHTWVALQDSGMAIVGVDEFAGKLLGSPDTVKLPRAGETCRQGAVILTLGRKEKQLEMLSPLDGQVVAVNDRVLDNPEAVVRSPYSGGWLMMVRPREIKRNLRNLISGPVARGWMEESVATLKSMFRGEAGLVFQDGGLPEEGLADQFTAREWRQITDRIFMIEPDEGGR